MKEQDENNLFEVRKEKLKKLREQGKDYPNSFRRNELAKELIKAVSYTHLTLPTTPYV